jgi:Protein of unknown function (DUF4197)
MKRGFVILILLLGTIPCLAQLGDLTQRLGRGKSSSLPDTKLASGLKEALQVGTANAVKSTGRVDGYFGNAAIKILMPEKMRTLEKGLRAVGYGPKVDEFVLSMNRAAERAAPAAKKIFLDAVAQMTFDDARKIFSGNDTAATEYFKSKTTAQLTTAFRPIVEKATSEAGVTQQYKQLAGRAQSIPFMRSESLDIDGYVVTKALDGLFYQLAQEEKNIRKNPAARVTKTLKEVFGT